MFLPDAFRHAIMIPDDIFPVAWKNRHFGDDIDPEDDKSPTDDQQPSKEQ
jgi:hypothetical protein